MGISNNSVSEVIAVDVWFQDHKLCIRLDDGREVAVPLEWFPKLKNANTKEINNWRLIGGGIGIHWTDLDEDIAVQSILQPYSFPLVIKNIAPDTPR